MNILTGKDKKIKNLIDAIGLPKHCQSFKIECKVNSPLTVSCVYFHENGPQLDEDGEVITFFKKYNLVEAEEE